jgi:hypothetical protein
MAVQLQKKCPKNAKIRPFFLFDISIAPHTAIELGAKHTIQILKRILFFFGPQANSIRTVWLIWVGAFVYSFKVK